MNSTYFSSLPESTVVPEQEDLFVSYFNRTYEEIASTVNNKDDKYFSMVVTDTAQDIPLVGTFGAFILCASGTESTLPCITVSLCKSTDSAGGSVATLGSQVGSGSWAANSLIISSSTTNFQIRHDNSGVSGNFNIRVIGTQI